MYASFWSSFCDLSHESRSRSICADVINRRHFWRMKSKIWILEWKLDLKIFQENSSKASCFSTSSSDKRESKIQRTQTAFQAIDVAVVCAFKQLRKSILRAISRASACESFVLRTAFLYSRCSHTKAWKLHDKNANKKNSAIHRANWIEFRHVESISSWDVSKRESIEISNHDEQIFSARRVASFQFSWARSWLLVCVKRNKSKVSDLNSFLSRRTSYAEMTQLRRTLFERFSY
jgi:hypothetical protein